MSLSNLTKVLKNRLIKTPQHNTAESDLINAESALGRTIFGAIPNGHNREFFHHQKNIWIWHENDTTIRYEVRPQGVFKKVANSKYREITGSELENFLKATKTYLNLVKTKLYS